MLKDHSTELRDELLSKRDDMSEYEQACKEHAAAFKIFDSARSQYRARVIGDNEFLLARQIFNVATAKYDLAFAKEQLRAVPLTAEECDDKEPA